MSEPDEFGKPIESSRESALLAAHAVVGHANARRAAE